jgi:hypothetical protein
MKTFVTLLLLTPLFSCGQKYFEGEIEYKIQTIKTDSSFDLNRIPCTGSQSSKIVYKNGDYISRFDNCFIEYEYFNHTLSQSFYKLNGSDTLLFENFKNPPESDSIISIKMYNNTDTILNKVCNRLVVQRRRMKMTFLYSPELKINPDWFRNSRGEYYDVIYGQMKSVFLKCIIEGEGYTSTCIATNVDSKPISSNVFPDVAKLPKVPL